MNKNKKTGPTDKNLALIAVILGAASFTNTIFTGIPAIIIGIIALRRNAGDRTQAKLGIIFGTIGSLLVIPIIIIAVHFLREPIREQFGISTAEMKNMDTLIDDLQEYKKRSGDFPRCQTTSSESGCADWNDFKRTNDLAQKYPVEFEQYFSEVEDRPTGTLVYVENAACFVNTPTHPSYVDDKEGRANLKNYVALVYFHEKGRSCFSANER